ncbi:thermonuclease family protein [Marinobacter koreensis]
MIVPIFGFYGLGLLLLLCAFSANASSSFGVRVDEVIDGDTVKAVSDAGRLMRIRLAGIDCPESDQPWGASATQAASVYMERKHGVVEEIGQDRYGRSIGRVFVDGVNMNRALVSDGHCWAYTRYVKDKVLFELQDQAEERQSGLWGLTDAEPVPPWEWRRTR